jgi:hypothetical protein
MNTQCPRCKTRLTAEGHIAGTQIECPECRMAFVPQSVKATRDVEIPAAWQPPQRVVVTSIDIPMVQMIWLTIKAIPAIAIGAFLFWLIVVVIGGAILTALAA